MRTESVPLEEVEVGAELALDLCDDTGRVLYTKGTILEEKQLRRLTGRGVGEVAVRVQRQFSEADRLQLRRKLEEELRPRFEHVMDQPLMRRLFEELVAYRMEQRA